MDLLKSTIGAIRPLNEEWYATAQKKLDNLTKPPGSLGRLEEFARKLVAISENEAPLLDKKVVFTFAGDHGITAEGVSAYPGEVTPQMVLNFIRGGAGINVLARHAAAAVVVVDIGVDYDFGDVEGLIKMKVMRGTENFAKGPAMTRDQAMKCLEVGIEIANGYARKGYKIYGTGDMGIGNTTPSS
ncbi:MAG TPA: nicotinate-nucleotide--dimethylbenzimidazole phosphoribosyltransferase, partial [Thermodesulfovibrionales bacterium]|nr:nicotinate-nucleotide--dimethylbenzimidazole phosphoribosyltransferase [Thermodesulfovibrionales bacterium]